MAYFKKQQRLDFKPEKYGSFRGDILWIMCSDITVEALTSLTASSARWKVGCLTPALILSGAEKAKSSAAERVINHPYI